MVFFLLLGAHSIQELLQAPLKMDELCLLTQIVATLFQSSMMVENIKVSVGVPILKASLLALMRTEKLIVECHIKSIIIQKSMTHLAFW